MVGARILFELATEIAHTLDREIPLQHLRTFLRVAMAGDAGIDQQKLQRETESSSAGMSRTVRALSNVSWDKRRVGHGVVEVTIDPSDNRRRIVRLTPKGKALLTSLASKLGTM